MCRRRQGVPGRRGEVGCVGTVAFGVAARGIANSVPVHLGIPSARIHPHRWTSPPERCGGASAQGTGIKQHDGIVERNNHPGVQAPVSICRTTHDGAP